MACFPQFRTRHKLFYRRMRILEVRYQNELYAVTTEVWRTFIKTGLYLTHWRVEEFNQLTDY